MTSQIVKEVIKIHNISRSKGHEAIKFCKLIECNVVFIFLQKLCRNDAGRLIPALYLFSIKTSFKVKASD